MSIPVLMRRLTPADAAAFHALRLTALRECPTAFSSSVEEECDTPLSVIEDRLRAGPWRHVFGAFDGGRLAGMVVLGRDNGRKTMHKAAIRGMYVAAGHRGKGLGRRLIGEALACARSLGGVRAVTLTVTAGNAAALALYQASGFETYGRERGALLVDGELYDDVLMALYWTA